MQSRAKHHRRSLRALMLTLVAAPMLAVANIPQIPFQELSLRDGLEDPFAAAPTLVGTHGLRFEHGAGEQIESALLPANAVRARMHRRTLPASPAPGRPAAAVNHPRN